MRALSDKKSNGSPKNRQKTPQIWDVFWRFFNEQFSYLVAESTQKWFFHQNNVRNVFSNIELPLGYNIMTLEYVLERTWKEIAKNMWKKSKIPQIRHFLGGGSWNSSIDIYLKFWNQNMKIRKYALKSAFFEKNFLAKIKECTFWNISKMPI